MWIFGTCGYNVTIEFRQYDHPIMIHVVLGFYQIEYLVLSDVVTLKI